MCTAQSDIDSETIADLLRHLARETARADALAREVEALRRVVRAIAMRGTERPAILQPSSGSGRWKAYAGSAPAPATGDTLPAALHAAGLHDAAAAVARAVEAMCHG